MITEIPNDLLYEIIRYLNIEEISKLCSTDLKFKQICLNERFWQLLVQRDFPTVSRLFNSWFYTYQYYNRKVYVLTVDGERDELVEIFDARENVIEYCMSYINKRYYYDFIGFSITMSNELRDIINDRGEQMLEALFNPNDTDAYAFVYNRYQITPENIPELLREYQEAKADYLNEITKRLRENGNVTIFNDVIFVITRKSIHL